MSKNITIVPFKGQDYNQLKKKFNKSNLFRDPLFTPEDKTLFRMQQCPKVEWKRPKEKFENAQFVVDDFNRNDFDQGLLGNCWFIAGCVGLLQSDSNFSRVVPKDQYFNDTTYNGMFHFRFFRYGEWVDVVIDDYLPFWPNTNDLVFCSNKQQKNEFWTPLLEKAYAKLYGSYELLDGGHISDAFIDMTGGLIELYSRKCLPKTQKEKEKFWKVLSDSYRRESLIGCSIEAQDYTREQKLSNGLVKGHAYTVTKVALIRNNDRLVRVRNPWGNEVEWIGAWSDKSKEWISISLAERQSIGLVIENDGEFWMSFDDFLNNFDDIQICHTTASSLSGELLKTDDDNDLEWKCTILHDEWIIGKSSGGPVAETFWTNPQFFVKLIDVDTNDNENLATIVVALMQKDSREKKVRTQGREAEEFIQFRLFRVLDNVQIDEKKQQNGSKFYSNQLKHVVDSGDYLNYREVTGRFRVQPGNYIIIPSTFEPNKSAKFMIRLYTKTKIETKHLIIDKPVLVSF